MNGLGGWGDRFGGFSDTIFSVVAAFLAGDSGRFVAEVEKVEL